jgi:hypothetical protein
MKTLILLLLITITSCNNENELIGTWKSNKELSDNHNKTNHSLSDDQKNDVDDYLGKKKIVYKKNNEAVAFYENNKIEFKYEIIKRKDNLIKIRIYDKEDPDDQETLYIHLVSSNIFWIDHSSAYLHKTSHLEPREYFEKQIKTEP